MTTPLSKLNFRLIVKGALAFAFTVLFSLPAHTDYSLDINQINEVTHLEIPDIVASDYQLSHNGDKVTFSLAGLNAKSAEKLKRYSDQHIKKIEISKNTSLSKDIVTIHLKGKNTQVFDYLTDSPSALSIDFYIDEKETELADANAAAAVKAGAKNKEITRAPTSEFIKSVTASPLIEIVKEGKDGTAVKKEIKTKKQFALEISSILDFDPSHVRFKTDTIIETRGNIFIKFPVLINQNDQLHEVVAKRVFYQVEAAEDEETTTMLKVKELFSKNDLKSFLRAKEVFIKKYPKSKFLEMLMFMEGDALYDLAREEKNETILEQTLQIYDAVLARFPNSPLAERTTLFIASLRMDRGEYLGAIRNLKTYINKYDKSPLRDNMQVYLAHCLLKVRQNDDAMDIFENLMESNDPDVKRQATYELGDAYFEKKEYNKAIQFYEKAWALYPEYKNDFPNAYFNKAEAEFIEELYADSMQSFKGFLKAFPQHTHAQYAWTRLGEIFEISAEDGQKWRAYYNEGMFRFGNTNGGLVSKIHIMAHQVAEAEKRRLPILLNEIKDLDKKIQLPQANEFLAFHLSDAQFTRGNYKEATDELIGFFKKVKIPTHAEKFHRRIGRGISFQIREKLAENKVEEAFKIYDQYDVLWFKKSERLDFSYLKGIAFEKTKAYKKAVTEYSTFIDKFKYLANQDEIIIIEKLPPVDEIFLRLAASQYQLKDYAAARDSMSKAEVKKMTAEKQDEAYLLLAKIADVNGQTALCQENLAQIKKANVESLALETKILEGQQKYTDALAVVDDYLEQNKPEKVERFNVLKNKLALMEKMGLNEKYYDFSARFFEEFKKTKFDFDAEKYKLGLHYQEKGKKKDAEEVWATVTEGTVWKKLASESMTSEKFADQYKKYIDRIPAMADKTTKEEKK